MLSASCTAERHTLFLYLCVSVCVYVCCRLCALDFLKDLMGTERERGGGTAVMAKSYTIALTGSGGLVGSELMSMLEGR